MPCVKAILRYIVFFANFFFLLAGLFLFSLGIGVQLRVGAIYSLVTHGAMDLLTVPVATMVLGLLVFLLSFFGCYAGIKQKFWMVISYATMMLALVGGKVGLAAGMFSGLNSVLASVPNVLAQAFSDNIQKFLELQRILRCCGTTNADVYGNPNLLPWTCCGGGPNCTISAAFPGCNCVLTTTIVNMSVFLGSMIITVAILELVVVVLGFWYAYHVYDDERVSE